MFDFYYSDPHFGHKNIIKFCNRPFVSALDMNMGLIQRYNRVVNEHHTVLWLGDCSMKIPLAYLENILSNLNGRKVLVRGNHDFPSEKLLGCFDLVLDEIRWRARGVSYVACHYPVQASVEYENPDRFQARRPTLMPGEVLLHGHDHAARAICPTRPRQINVGVDAWDYAPAPAGAVHDMAQIMLKS